MATTRPCAICRRWFEVDPRVGKRHRVCGGEACRASRNKRACAKWRAEHPDEVKATRIRKKLPKQEPDVPEVVLPDPMRHFDPSVVRHAIGVEAKVVLEEVSKVIVALARHERAPKPRVQRPEITRDPPPAARLVVAHGTGKRAVIAPEMEAFGSRLGFVFVAHEKGDANRSAHVERQFDHIENNFYAHGATRRSSLTRGRPLLCLRGRRRGPDHDLRGPSSGEREWTGFGER